MDTLDRTMNAVKTAAEAKTEHPAAKFIIGGYFCEAAINGGWTVIQAHEYRNGDRLEQRFIPLRAAFSNWTDMMDWLRKGHEAIAPISGPVPDSLLDVSSHGWIDRPIDDRNWPRIPIGMRVEVRYRNGEYRIGGSQEFRWNNDTFPMQRDDDIVAYRLI